MLSHASSTKTSITLIFGDNSGRRICLYLDDAKTARAIVRTAIHAQAEDLRGIYHS